MPPAIRALLAAPTLTLALTLGVCPAQAGVVRCWIDQGVLVVPAMVAGVAGDYIVDTGARGEQLHETRAQAAGLVGAALTAEVRIAGLTFPGRPVQVVDLDARTYAFPTPIAGVIGADLLAGHVLDVSFAPCRVGLWRKGREPVLRGGRALALTLADGRPLVAAGVADGVRAELGLFVPSTGLDAAARIAADDAVAAGGATGDLLPYGRPRARLRALSFAGELWENLPAGRIARADLPSRALGEIGPRVLADWRLRFDVTAGRLWLAPRLQTKRAPVSRGPSNAVGSCRPSGRRSSRSCGS